MKEDRNKLHTIGNKMRHFLTDIFQYKIFLQHNKSLSFDIYPFSDWMIQSMNHLPNMSTSFSYVSIGVVVVGVG